MGKGHTQCGSKGCAETGGLHSFELPFKYHEQGDLKVELVKVRLCRTCAPKIFHSQLKKSQPAPQASVESGLPHAQPKKRSKRSDSSFI